MSNESNRKKIEDSGGVLEEKAIRNIDNGLGRVFKELGKLFERLSPPDDKFLKSVRQQREKRDGPERKEN